MSYAKPKVLLFTESYPFEGGERSFLPPEVQHLNSKTSLVIIPSLRPEGDLLEMPEGVTVNTDLAAWNSRSGGVLRNILFSLFSPAFFGELLRQAPLSLRPHAMVTLAMRHAKAERTRKWISTSGIVGNESQPVVAYSWWSSTTALGVARALQSSGIPVVSRAHGYDLFAEQETIGFTPFQGELLERSTAVCSVSEAGSKRLRSLYPQHSDKVSTARLGVVENKTSGPRLSGQPFQVVSCSAVLPLKRVELIYEAVGILRQRIPMIDARWTHIGAGSGMAALERELAGNSEAMQFTTLLGQISPKAVMDWYATHPVDVFVNVSSSEGVSVSLMEAASMGIPLMATDVGGTSEIVTRDCGVLLPADPTPDQVADALADLATAAQEKLAELRMGAYRMWQSRYSASRNYSEFTDWLVSIAVR